MREEIAKPKALWRDMSPWAEAACDERGLVPLNTVYYVPCDDALRAWMLTAWLNARATRASLRGVAERAQHGYRRQLGWTVASMKMPRRWGRWLAGAQDVELEAECAYWRAHPEGALKLEARLLKRFDLDAELVDEACAQSAAVASTRWSA